MSLRKLFYSLLVVLACTMFLPSGMVFAGEQATPDEVYELILKAVPVVEELGQAGLEAFNDPHGEFVYKETYILVLDCATMTIAAHPNNKIIGRSLKGDLDKNPDPAKRIEHGEAMCEVGNRPNGGWLAYYWDKIGSSEPARKISFCLRVPGKDYTLVAGIYDETTSVEELNSQLK